MANIRAAVIGTMIGTGVGFGILGLAVNITAEHAAHEQSQLQSQVQALRSELATLADKAAGGHRDLITCADVQAMGLQTLLDVGLNTDAGGNLSAVPDQVPVTLPPHCINQ